LLVHGSSAQSRFIQFSSDQHIWISCCMFSDLKSLCNSLFDHHITCVYKTTTCYVVHVKSNIMLCFLYVHCFVKILTFHICYMTTPTLLQPLPAESVASCATPATRRSCCPHCAKANPQPSPPLPIPPFVLYICLYTLHAFSLKCHCDVVVQMAERAKPVSLVTESSYYFWVDTHPHQV
jgi:hypothetical protein